MNTDPDDSLREIVTDLEGIQTSVEELQLDGADGESLEELKTVLEQAVDIADAIEEQDEET